MSGGWISNPGGDRNGGRVYLAVPEGGGGPGLVLLEETSGPEIANLYAQEGYVVVCPDRLDVDVGAAVQSLRSSSECTGEVGILGFAKGGMLAYRARQRAASTARLFITAPGSTRWLTSPRASPAR